MSDDDGRPATAGVPTLTRRAALAAAGGLAGVGVISPAAARAQASTRAVAAPPVLDVAMEVFGSIAQVGNTLTGYGFLTRVAGVPTASLFAGPAHSEATARLTFFATAAVDERFVRPTLFSVAALGRLSVFLHPNGGGDFTNPQSFAGGTRIATYDARFVNRLTLIATAQAVNAMTGELRQTQAAVFSLAGRRRRFGRRGLRLRLTATGPGTRNTDPTTPRAVFDVGGELTVIG
jgi:hypothetical protein